MTANGQSVWAGGGAGGSVHIMAGQLSGAGSITADGGNAGYVLAGGGGGGRVAVYYGHSAFSGVLTARGGVSPEAGSGGVGTVYTQNHSQTVGDLLLDNTGRTNAVESPLTSPVAFRLTLRNAAAIADVPLTLSSLRVGDRSLLTHPFQGPRLQVTVHGNAVVESGGAVAAIARGYPSQTGPGHGVGAEGSSGAGHGGQAGAGYSAGPGGVTYGSMTEPTDFGSGGGGGFKSNRGGGAIQLAVDGTLTIDGTVSADADQGNCGNCWDGGGSGGSVWLTAGRLNGRGGITANGQLATYPLSGSGGGGRIAIYAGVNQFAGTVWASGGKSADRPGHDGTSHVTNVPPGLVSWWPGEASGADVVGPNSLTPHSSVHGTVGYAPGLVGTAFALGGGFFEAPWSPSLYFKWGETAMTFECWVYNQTTYLPFHICGVRDDSGDQSKWQIGYDTSYNTPPPPLNQWSHVAIAIETNEFVVYLNGQPDWVIPNPQWGTGPNTGTPFRLGTSASWAPLIGLVDEARYYSRALSSSEIAVLYATHADEILPSPTLSATVAAGGVLLSWPAVYEEYGVVTRPDLAPGIWEAVTNAPSLIGTRKEVLLPASERQRFFRLKSGN